MVADDLDLSLAEAEKSIRLVFSALNKQLTEREGFQIRQWLPEEVIEFWPAEESAPLQT